MEIKTTYKICSYELYCPLCEKFIHYIKTERIDEFIGQRICPHCQKEFIVKKMEEKRK